GIGEGQNALAARWTMTAESLPPEKRRAALRNSAAVSRRMWMASLSMERNAMSLDGTADKEFIVWRSILGQGAMGAGGIEVQAAFLRLRIFPPPASGADVLAGRDRARARGAADAGIALVVQRV